MHRIVLAFIVLPLALAACSQTQYKAARELAPAATVQQAAKKTAAATSEHVVLDAAGTGGTFSGAVTGSGDFDNAKHRGSFHLDVTNYGSIDAVVDGTSAYVKAPFLVRFLPPGKTWLKLHAKPREFGVVPQNPKQALARLKKLVNVRKVADETVDGVSTTHYHGTGRLEGSRGTFDVWIGKDDGYVRRVQAAASGKNGNGHATVTFSDFGKAVTVSVPPASDTADGTNLVPFFQHG
jgi:LppX_LprAFG lipoprotein